MISSLLTSCAFSAVHRPTLPADPALTREYPATFTNLYDAARFAVGSMGFNIPYEAAAEGLISTNTLRVPLEDNCDCGTWNWDRVKGNGDLSLNIRASEVDAQRSRLRVEAIYQTTFTGRNGYGQVTHVESYRCLSLGRKERDVFDRVDQYFTMQNR
jgi:hypothetical protein